MSVIGCEYKSNGIVSITASCFICKHKRKDNVSSLISRRYCDADVVIQVILRHCEVFRSSICRKMLSTARRSCLFLLMGSDILDSRPSWTACITSLAHMASDL